MSDEGLVVDSDAVSMEDLLAAFAADPLVDGGDNELAISDIKKAVLRESKKFRRKARKAAQQLGELTAITLDDDNSNALGQSSLGAEMPSARDFNEYFLQDFFGSEDESGNGNEISHIRSVELSKVASVPREAHFEEIDRLKSLVLEAQETIIKLLTDRVEDKARLATLEAQLKFLPLQHLGDANAIQLRNEQESLRTQLSEIRHEIQKNEIGKIRHSMSWDKQKPKSSLIDKFLGRS
jgi:hypothetical protein